MLGIKNNFSMHTAGQDQPSLQYIENLSQKPFLTEEDKKKFLDFIKKLPDQIKQSAAVIDIVVHAKKVFDRHDVSFSQTDKKLVQSIFSQALNRQNMSVDQLQKAQSLKEGRLDKKQSFAQKRLMIAAYLKDKTLKESREILFEFFKKADLSGYEELRKDLCKEILRVDDSIRGALLDYVFASNNNELIIKCLPYLIKDKNLEEIAAISYSLNKNLFFPKEWLVKIKDGATKGALLQAQYETEQITLNDLKEILDSILKKESFELRVFPIKEDGKEALGVHLAYQPSHYEVFKLLSQIKIIKYVSLSCYESPGEKIENFNFEKMRNITFPHVEKVQVGGVQGDHAIFLAPLGQLFPNAKRYLVDPMPVNDESAGEVLSKIPKTITHLSFGPRADFSNITNITNVTAVAIGSMFKLQSFTGWEGTTEINEAGFSYIMRNN